MPSYLITGVSRGLGYGLLQILAADANNTVIGLVRDKSTTDAKIVAELGELNNVHILQADVLKYADLAAVRPAVDQITGGALDYIIANAAIPGTWSAFRNLDTVAQEPEKLEEDYLDVFRVNVMGNVHLFNLFMPLVLKGKTKKVIHIASAQSVLDLSARQDVFIMAPYAASKSAMNIVVAKYSAFYRHQGVLFLSVAPGAVDTEYYRGGDLNDEIMANMNTTMAKYKQYAPHFERPQTPMEAARQVLDVVERSDITRGDAGQFVSQFGNQQWL